MRASWSLILGSLAVAILLALASVPWWLGAALHPVARAFGADFARYERVGYTRFRIEDVRWRRPGMTLTAGVLEADTPLVWLGRRLAGREPLLRIEEARLVRSAARPARDETSIRAISGLPQLQSVLRAQLPRAWFWVPRAELTHGLIAGWGPAVRIARAEWDRSGLRIGEITVAGHQADAVLTASGDSVTLRAEARDDDARLELDLRGGELAGTLHWREQPADIRARFPESGWWPEEAAVTADKWDVPAGPLKLGRQYDVVHGSAHLAWRDGRWSLTATANASPRGDQAPPLDLRATAQGDRQTLTVESLHLDAPFARARLSAPVTFAFGAPSPEREARLQLEADLAQFPWFDARGHATGAVTVTAVDRAARLAFDGNISDAAWRSVSVQAARARGTLQWPLLSVDSLTAELSPRTQLVASGRLDLATRELAAVELRATAAPADLAPWLPAGLAWRTATLEARLEGPLAAPRHAGHLAFAELTRPPLQPIEGTAEWEGSGLELDRLDTQLRAGESKLELSARVDPAGADLRALRVENPGKAPWTLAAPVHVARLPAWDLGELRLASAEGHLRLRGNAGPAGAWAVDVGGFASALITPWIRVPGPAWRIASLRAQGRRGEDGFAFSTRLAGEVDLPAGAARVALSAEGDRHGLRLEEFTAATGERVLTRASGRLPVVWNPGTGPRLRVDAEAPLELKASIDPDSPVWALLSAPAGIRLDQPSATLDVSGTLARPSGRVVVGADAIRRAGEAPAAWPEVTALRLEAELSREALSITRLEARLDGQPLAGHAVLPLDDERWTTLWHEPTQLDWKAARGRLTLADANLAVFAQRLPKVVAPQGRIEADVQLGPGGKLEGSLRVTGAATRPLSPFGVVQDIHADLRLEDRTLRISSLSGRLGGEPMQVTGTITRTPGGAWRPELSLQGKNLPLVRSSGLLLRTDLDLRTRAAAQEGVQIEGVVTVRDCLVLASLSSLLPSGARGATRTPPYFSVDAAPFRDWALAVDLRGTRAVRARTAVFEGTATPAFRLTGTLGEPRAVGQLTVDEGRVIFPFAVFAIQQGTVRLGEADPFTPRIDARATARRHGYDLVLEAGGTPTAPTLTFSSNPALDAADVLMMVTTGRPPESGAGGLDTPQRLARFGTFLGRGLIQEFGIGGGDRLEISTGEDVSRAGRETYRIEYRVNDRWFLVGEYDEYDQYNAGVRWRVHTVGGADDE